MRVRVLPPSEYGRLTMAELQPPIWPSVAPEDIAIVVVEDGGRILATMSVIRIPHLESVWIAPEHRGNAGIGRALFVAAMEQAQRWAPHWVMVNAADEKVDDLVERLGGTQLPIRTYFVPFRRDEPCPTQ